LQNYGIFKINLMKKYFILPLILLAGFFLKCERNDNFVDDTDCSNTICTMEYRTITVIIKHKTDGTIYNLTDYKVTRVSDNKDITIKPNDLFQYNGSYPVINDSQQHLVRNTDVEVEFTGYVSGSVVIQKRLIVTADCCHVSLVQGDTIFYL
jgi:hypothetical protein